MKIGIFFVLMLSGLCELEAQTQAEPLVPESQKNQVVIPTAGKEPIKINFSNNVRAVNVDGHKIAYSQPSQKDPRKLPLIRRRVPFRRNDDLAEGGDNFGSEGEQNFDTIGEDQGGDVQDSVVIDQNPTYDVVEEEEASYAPVDGDIPIDGGNDEDTGFDQWPDSGDQEEQQEQGQPLEESYPEEEYFEGEKATTQEEPANAEQLPSEEFEEAEGEDQCPEKHTYEYLESVLDNQFSHDPNVLEAEIQNLDDTIDEIESHRFKKDFTIDAGLLQKILNDLQSLANFKKAFECDEAVQPVSQEEVSPAPPQSSGEEEFSPQTPPEEVIAEPPSQEEIEPSQATDDFSNQEVFEPVPDAEDTSSPVEETDDSMGGFGDVPQSESESQSFEPAADNPSDAPSMEGDGSEESLSNPVDDNPARRNRLNNFKNLHAFRQAHNVIRHKFHHLVRRLPNVYYRKQNVRHYRYPVYMRRSLRGQPIRPLMRHYRPAPPMIHRPNLGPRRVIRRVMRRTQQSQNPVFRPQNLNQSRFHRYV